ncbi:MAG: hypothetical protein NXI31_23135 [bacterium]|nr:hypothetical protein [bacterium]
MARDNVEHTRWSPGLIGFYLSCAGTAMGSTIAASGWFFFGSKGAIVVGALLAVVSIVFCFVSLHAARQKPGNGAD